MTSKIKVDRFINNKIVSNHDSHNCASIGSLALPLKVRGLYHLKSQKYLAPYVDYELLACSVATII